MLFRSLLLPGVLAPALAGALMLLVFAVLGRRGGVTGYSGGGPALAVAFLASYVAMTGWPRWPPVEATQRLFFLVAAAGLFSPALTRWRGRTPAWAVRSLLVAALLALMLQPLYVHGWNGGQRILWLLGLGAAGLTLHSAFAASFRTDGAKLSWGAAVVRLVLLGGTAVALGLSGSARLAQLVGAVASAMVVVEIGARGLRRRPWRCADALVPATVLMGLLAAGHFYAELESWPALLLLIAFFFSAIPAQGRPWLRLAALIPMVIALWMAYSAFQAKGDDPYADYYASVTTTSRRLKPAESESSRPPSPSRPPAEPEAPSRGWRARG